MLRALKRHILCCLPENQLVGKVSADWATPSSSSTSVSHITQAIEGVEKVALRSVSASIVLVFNGIGAANRKPLIDFRTEVRAERILAGQSAARDRGVHWGGSARGRRIKVTGEQVAAIRRQRSEGEEIAAIARATGLSRPTIYRILGEECQGSILPGDGRPAGGIACATRPM
jgi:hypothetical protein